MNREGCVLYIYMRPSHLFATACYVRTRSTPSVAPLHTSYSTMDRVRPVHASVLRQSKFTFPIYCIKAQAKAQIIAVVQMESRIASSLLDLTVFWLDEDTVHPANPSHLVPTSDLQSVPCLPRYRRWLILGNTVPHGQLCGASDPKIQ